jgi:hypothetical protein
MHAARCGVVWCAVGRPDLTAWQVLTLGAGIGDSATVSETSMLDAAGTAFSAAHQRIPSQTLQQAPREAVILMHHFHLLAKQ